MLPAGVSTKRATEQPWHLNRDRTRKIHCNSLRNFPLHRFRKHIPWFRCCGKVEHLNRNQTQRNHCNTLKNFLLYGFSKHLLWFRCQQGLERSGMQMCPGGASGGGATKRAAEQPGASEPEQNPRKSLQHIGKLYIAGFQQESPLVQMQRKRRASEPCNKAESSRQPTHNKRVAGLSVTVPEVQIPGGSGMPRNANTPWRHFWQGYPPNTQQNSPGI